MKNTIGSSLSFTLFGESHGAEMGCVIDGLAPGLPVREESIAAALARRRPQGDIGTPRVEMDNFRIVSGVFHGRTTGAPLCILIANECKRSADYECAPRLARPSHADLAAFEKYHGFEDYRGGGHFSGRLTAPIVAAGAIVRDALAARGIIVCAHIASIASVSDRSFADIPTEMQALSRLSPDRLPVLDENAATAMTEAILAAAREGDSVGGVVECAVLGMPAGVGEPFFDSVESVLSHWLFSIPAVKGVEFGDGFAITALRGSEANDALYQSDEGVVTQTNHTGGICGGITVGTPILLRAAIKPTPSIFKPQKTVSLPEKENATLTLKGRHDPCIVPRALPVVEAACALALADLLALRFGTDYLNS